MTIDFDAVVVAGGRGSRLGGVSKSDLEVGGRALRDTALAAVGEAKQRVVVGPPMPVPADVLLTREDPAGTGPCAGLVAGVAALGGRGDVAWVLVLAVDLPLAPQAVRLLLRAWRELLAAGRAPDSVCLQHPDGSRQHLLGIHRRAALERAIAGFGDPAGRSVRSLLDRLNPVVVAAPAEVLGDLDTPADAARWGATVVDPQDRLWRRFWQVATTAAGVDVPGTDPAQTLAITRAVSRAGAKPMAPVVAELVGRAAVAGRTITPERVREALARADGLRPEVSART